MSWYHQGARSTAAHENNPKKENTGKPERSKAKAGRLPSQSQSVERRELYRMPLSWTRERDNFCPSACDWWG